MSERTRVQPPPVARAAEPPRRSSGRNLLALALAAACGVLLGGSLFAVLGAGRTTTVVRRVTVAAPARTTGGTVITKTAVPVLVGEPLDVAKQRADRARFSVHVDEGAGILGVLRDANWQVVDQRPPAGGLLEQGSTLHVDIARR